MFFFIFFHLRFVLKTKTANTNSLSSLHSKVSYFFFVPYFKMAIIKASGSFVTFTLPLDDDHHVKVSEDLLNLRFNLRIGSMYHRTRDVFHERWYLRDNLIPKNLCQDGYVWILGTWSVRVIGLSDTQIRTSTILLTNESGGSIVNVLIVPTVKIEPSVNDVLVLLDSDENVYLVVDLSDTSPFRISLGLPIRFGSLWMLIIPLIVRRIWNLFVMVLPLNVHLFTLLHLLQVSILLIH